jgi:hypothetical protein
MKKYTMKQLKSVGVLAMSDFPCATCKYRTSLYACEQSSCPTYQAWKKSQDNPLYREIAQIAYDEVIKTMLEGEKTYPNNEGYAKSVSDHLEHALGHAEKAYVGDKKENHFGHAITRMAIAIHKKGDTP